MMRQGSAKDNHYNYLNFPITLIEGYLCDEEVVLKKIFCYVAYKQAISPNIDNIESEFNDIVQYYNVDLGPLAEAFGIGKKLFEETPDKQPITGIKVEILAEFYQEHKEDFEKLCLLAFLALKSIIGNKPNCLTNNNMLFSRMDGRIKSVDYSELSYGLQKYVKTKDTILYHSKKIREALADYWGCVFYSDGIKGYWFSNKQDYIELGVTAETKKKANAAKRKSDAKMEANAKIKAILKGEPAETTITDPGRPVEDDNEKHIKWDILVEQFNEFTGKSVKVVPPKVKKEFMQRLNEGYSKDDIFDALINCANDEFHRKNGYRDLTLEFLSRADKIEKYATVLEPKSPRHPTTGNKTAYKFDLDRAIASTNQLQPKYDD